MDKMKNNQTQNQKDPANQMKVAPAVSNDQLGENADLEFAEDYDNKSNQIAKNTKNAQKNRTQE